MKTIQYGTGWDRQLMWSGKEGEMAKWAKGEKDFKLLLPSARLFPSSWFALSVLVSSFLFAVVPFPLFAPRFFCCFSLLRP